MLEGVSVGAAPDAVDPADAAIDPPPLDAATALLHLDRISLHLSRKDLREGIVRLSEIALEAPSVRVIREADGAIDPLRHARPLAPPSEDAVDEEPPGEPWAVAVDRFTLSTPNVVVVDPPSGAALLEFSLEKFSLDGVSAKGEQFALGGIGVEGPVLRVRRDLVLAAPSGAAAPAQPKNEPAAAPPKSVAPAAPAQAAAPAGYRIEKIPSMSRLLRSSSRRGISKRSTPP